MKSACIALLLIVWFAATAFLFATVIGALILGMADRMDDWFKLPKLLIAKL